MPIIVSASCPLLRHAGKSEYSQRMLSARARGAASQQFIRRTRVALITDRELDARLIAPLTGGTCPARPGLCARLDSSGPPRGAPHSLGVFVQRAAKGL